MINNELQWEVVYRWVDKENGYDWVKSAIDTDSGAQIVALTSNEPGLEEPTSIEIYGLEPYMINDILEVLGGYKIQKVKTMKQYAGEINNEDD